MKCARPMSPLLAVPLLAALPALAFEIGWWSVDGGGGRSVGDGLVLSGTVAQVEAGVLAGGDLVLEGGFHVTRVGGAVGVPDEEAPADPRVAFLHGGAPNPFLGGTAIAFDLPRPERTRIAVYDLAGRLVDRLVDGTLPAGRHRVNWNGRDRAGRPVASGVYFVHMQAGEYGAVRKVLRME